METHLNIIGTLCMALAGIHIGFPTYFKWKQELSTLSLVNRQMIYVHTLFIAFIVFLMGLLCLIETKSLMETLLGKKICLGLALFWMLRLGIQFMGYSPKLWRGKTFETLVHIVFTITFIYFSTVFLYIYSS